MAKTPKATINESPIKEYIGYSRTLNQAFKAWYCSATPAGGQHSWLSPQMLEQLIITDPEALKLAKAATDEKGTRKFIDYLENVIYVKYIKIILGKLKHMSADLAEYFAVKATVNWEEDKKEYEALPYNGIEPKTVSHPLIDRE